MMSDSLVVDKQHILDDDSALNSTNSFLSSSGDQLLACTQANSSNDSSLNSSSADYNKTSEFEAELSHIHNKMIVTLHKMIEFLI